MNAAGTVLCLCIVALVSAKKLGDSRADWQHIEPFADTDTDTAIDSGFYVDYGENSSCDQDPGSDHGDPDSGSETGNSSDEDSEPKNHLEHLERLYCNTKCGKRHLACGPIKFGLDCPRSTSIVDLGNHKEWILQLHNDLRNKVAGGEDSCSGGELPLASRMGEMMWEEELAALAMIYAMNCQLHFKTCYTTARFPYVGRNSALYKTARKRSLRQLIQGRIEYWFQQLDDVKPEHVQRYPAKKPSAPISSVAVAINEKSNRIGCGAVQFQADNMNNFLLVCFYAYTNVHNTKIYTIGQPTSQCRSGTSRLYPFLCDVNEPYSYD